MKIPFFPKDISGAKNWIPGLIIFILIFFMFRGWFSFLPLSTGDWIYRFPQSILEFNFYPYAWSTNLNNGFGSNGVFLLPLNTYFSAGTGILFAYLGIPWVLIEKIMWFWPFIFISALGSFIFFKRFFVNDITLSAVSSLIFTVNTYSFMVTGGGQLGVGMGYSMIPLVFYGFLGILEDIQDKKKILFISILTGVLFSIQIIFDLRIAYVTIIFVGIYYLLSIATDGLQQLKKSFFWFAVVPAVVAFFINFFWVIPFVISGRNPLNEFGAQYSGTNIVEFLSFAKIENAISILHPNWPENLFGKVYFMRPEFILLPILAFGALVFIKKDKYRKNVIVFSLIALLAAFLVKGTNEPFGTFYTWAFGTVPGFQMFRDPTKWYGLVIFSFSLLIPFTLFVLSKLKPKITSLKNLLVIIFVIFWVITVRQAFMGDIKGTLAPKNSPQQYLDLAKFLGSQDDFFRTLWVPGFHQYSYFSNNHPEISAEDYFSFHTPDKIAGKIQGNLQALADGGIKYVIIPDDTEGRIFTDDRKYDENKYKKTVQSLRKVYGLKEVATFSGIMVFSVPGVRDHFWSSNPSLKIQHKVINPTKFLLEITNAKKGDRVVFSESYDPGWYMKGSKFQIQSSQYKNKLNSFVIPEVGNYELEVYYKPQALVDKTLIVSVGSLIFIFAVLVWLKFKK